MLTSKKRWYKKWWGVIIAILILPYFLLWLVWAKLKWSRSLKLGATVVLIALCILDLVGFTDWASHQTTQPTANKMLASTTQQPQRTTSGTSNSATTVACQRPSTPASAQSSYTNASQIIQVLVSHNVPCSNVVKDTGISSFTGATSGVWVETAPGDNAAQFGGSENGGTDTEIVVFQNNADATAYANIGGGDGSHQVILGTNWAIDAATPAVASISAALGVTSNTSTPTSSTKSATSSAHTVTYQFTLISGSLTATDIQNVGISWHNPDNGQNTLPTDIAGAIQQISGSGYSVTLNTSKVNDDNIWAGVNNYNDSDASIACSILIDGQMVVTETAPTSGYADCSANGLDSESGH